MPRHNATIDKEDGKSRYLVGAGSTIEVMSRSDEDHVRVSGLAEAIGMLNLPLGNVEDGDYMTGTLRLSPRKDVDHGSSGSPRKGVLTVVDKGNGYVQLCLPNHVMTRFQLNDLMNGLEWRVEGFSTCYDKDTLVVHELWRKSIRKFGASPRRESKDLTP